jgi:multiple sugar transport system substrate-binding protein
MVRRMLLCVVVLLAAASLAFAAGQQEKAKEGKVVIMVGSHGTYLIDQTAEAFHAENPNIAVEIVPISSVPQEYWQTYVTMFTAQDGSASIIGWYPMQIYHMARAGWLTPIEELADRAFMQDELRKYDQTAIESNTIGGKLYGLPLYPDALMLYYRTDLLAKYGMAVPTTWAELEREVLSILKGEGDSSLSGYIWQARKIEGITANFRQFESGNGGRILDDNGKAAFDSPENLEIARMWKDWLDKGVVPKTIAEHNPNDDRIQFGNGDGIFMNNWPFAMATYLKEDSPVYGKVAITRPSGKSGVGRCTLGGVGLGINNFTEDKQAAFAFLKYLTNDNWNKQRALRASLLPGRPAVYQDPEVAGNPAFKEFAKAAPYLIALPTHKTPYYLKVSDAIQLHLNRMVSYQETPEVAIRAANQEIAKVLAEGE